MAELLYKDITEKIIGAAFEVYRELGRVSRKSISEGHGA
jgi:hypothetical protein